MPVLKLLVSVLFLAALALCQQIAPRRARDYDPRSPLGQFDVRLYVDGEADVFVQGDSIRCEIVSGAPLRDAGSEYTQPIPQASFVRFDWEKKDGRGRARLLEEPSPSNGYTARIRIEDRDGGEDRYHVRLRWEVNQAASPPAQARRSVTRAAPSGLPGVPLSSFDNNPSRYDRGRSGSFAFRGRVDDEVVFHIRGDVITAQVMQGRPVRLERFRFSQPLPTRRLREFELKQFDGRGTVELVQRPDSLNNYTAIVRVIDPERGDARYHFELHWRE